LAILPTTYNGQEILGSSGIEIAGFSVTKVTSVRYCIGLNPVSFSAIKKEGENEIGSYSVSGNHISGFYTENKDGNLTLNDLNIRYKGIVFGAQEHIESKQTRAAHERITDTEEIRHFYRRLTLKSGDDFMQFDNDGNLKTSNYKLEAIPHISVDRLIALADSAEKGEVPIQAIVAEAFFQRMIPYAPSGERKLDYLGSVPALISAMKQNGDVKLCFGR